VGAAGVVVDGVVVAAATVVVGAAVVVVAILAVVVGIAATGVVDMLEVGKITTFSVLFLGLVVVFGERLVRALAPAVISLDRHHGKLLFPLALAFIMSWLASSIQLASIVGAFAAGLVLDEAHYKNYRELGDHGLEELIHPIAVFLVPIFFVLMGIRVDLSTFGQKGVLGFAAALSVAAIIGKMICALGVVEKGLDRVSVAVGMVPRGEVGLIFAGIGAALILRGQPVISVPIFSAVVIMVIVTTLMTPPVLKITLARGDKVKENRSPAEPQS